MKPARAWIAIVIVCATQASGNAGAADLLRVGGKIVKWASPESGSPALITYMALTEALVVPSGKRTLSPDNCGAMRPFADITTASPNVPPALARTALSSAFQAWENVANIRFVEVDDVRHANLVVGAAVSSRGRAFANLTLRDGMDGAPIAKSLGQSAPDRPQPLRRPASDDAAEIEQAYVCLNPTARWKTGFDGDLAVYDLRFTFVHEIGHAIGLDHPGSSGSVMGYRYDEHVTSLQPADIDAVQRLYGASGHGN